jgi:hypothetical protein
MRKKNRIRPSCERLADAWEKFPVILSEQFICGAYTVEELKCDPFYIEDDESMRPIEKCANECSPYHKPPKEE